MVTSSSFFVGIGSFVNFSPCLFYLLSLAAHVPQKGIDRYDGITT